MAAPEAAIQGSNPKLLDVWHWMAASGAAMTCAGDSQRRAIRPDDLHFDRDAGPHALGHGAEFLEASQRLSQVWQVGGPRAV